MEMINFWLKQLIKNSGKTTVEELTVNEIVSEIEDVKGTISNEKLWALVEDIHYENIAKLEEYLKLLEDILYDKRNLTTQN